MTASFSPPRVRHLVVPAAPASPLSLGLLTPHDPWDATAFSGTARHAMRALAGRPDVALRVLGHPGPRPALLRRIDRLVGRTPPGPDPARLDPGGLDAILGLVATPLLAALPDTAPPILHVTDATPAFLREAYGRPVPRTADAAERLVARRAALCLYSSRAIAARAARDLDLPGFAPAVLPFGVNIDALPTEAPEKPRHGPVELLFIGTDWLRKGGDVALAAFDQLQARGLDIRLTLVGGARPAARPGLRVCGFLDKTRPRDAARLSRLYARAHLLILPSRADCTPMVVAEAMAHGTPVLASDTGGVAELVGGAGAGGLLPPGSEPAIWAEAIEAMIRDRDGLALLSDAAFDRAQSRFSWQAWADGIVRAARAATAPPRLHAI